MKKNLIHYFWYRKFKQLFLVFLCFFCLNKSYSQIVFKYDKDKDEEPKLFIEHDYVIIDGIKYSFHCDLDVKYNDAGGIVKIEILNGYFIAESYDGEQRAKVSLYKSLSSDAGQFTISSDGSLSTPKDPETGYHYTYPVINAASGLFQEVDAEEVYLSFVPNNMNGMFENSVNLRKVVFMDGCDTKGVGSMHALFWGCNNLTEIDWGNIDTSNVTDMSSMFGYCTSLTSLDLSSFDTSNVIYMGQMFDGCSSLSSLDLSNFDTKKVTHMGMMFHYCTSLASLDLSSFDTKNGLSCNSPWMNRHTILPK